jgi:hypothetical protein
MQHINMQSDESKTFLCHSKNIIVRTVYWSRLAFNLYLEVGGALWVGLPYFETWKLGHYTSLVIISYIFLVNCLKSQNTHS